MIERILSKAQRRTVMAVYADRQRLVQELGECDAALNDLAQTYRVAYDLPEGEYLFRGDGNEIRIVKVETAAAAEIVPGQQGDQEKSMDAEADGG